MSLELTAIHHRYGARAVLRGVDVAVAAGEIVCLLGPSGDGKTTLLRIASGLEAVQAGRVAVGGRVMAEPGREVPPEARGLGFVFQDYALFPHLTVGANVAFGLRGLPRAERAARVAGALGRVGLAHLADSWPHVLSGGQQQRVALARAMAPRPTALLLDEAFASLDARLREQVRDDTLHVLQQAGIATLIVTHDAEEALFMADRIVLLEGGRVAQDGTPADLYLRPASAFVATFLGEVNRLEGRVAAGAVATPFGPLPAPGLPEGAAAAVLVRPEGLALADGGVPAEVAACRLLGATTLVHLAVAGPDGPLHLHARLPAGPMLARGARVALALNPARAFVFPAGAAPAARPAATG